jgi:two-component system, cell cycle response regulator
MRILVADDDEVTVAVLAELLRDLGHEAIITRNGTEAWEALLKADAPALAILDWMMPGIDGVEICRKLRQVRTKPYQYLIMLTARDQTQDLVESIESGADDYLKKPFDSRELRARVHAGERLLLLHDELRAQASFDGLTGLLNRATIMERLERELAQAQRKAQPTSVIMADLDNFKQINDRLGHAAGDDALREAAKRLPLRLRSYDEVGRYGGEEFLTLLPGCPGTAALQVAGRMRDALRSRPVSTSGGAIEVTASFGVATWDATQNQSAAALVAEADAALYRAKRAGRDRVEGPVAI